MGYKRKFDHGDVPDYGAIFMSNTGTKKECFQRKLFGLPLAQSDFVLNVKKGMFLFLFEFKRRQLHGVFRATSNGEIDIEPNAFKSSGNYFPAQVSFTCVWNCYPLAEHEFKDAIRDNYFSWKKFKFGLSKDQVNKLMALFRSKRISQNNNPSRTRLRYYDDDDKPTERDTSFGDNRKKGRDRIKFIKEEDDNGFGICEVKEVDDDQGCRTRIMKERSQKDKKEEFLTNHVEKSRYDYGDRGSRKLDKYLQYMRDINNNSNRNKMHNGKPKLKKLVKREHDNYGRFGKSSVAKKRKCFRDDDDRGSEPVVDGWFFREKSQQGALTDHPLSKLEGDTQKSPNYEPTKSPFEPRGKDFGIKLEFDLENVSPTTLNSSSNLTQNNSDFTPKSEALGQFQRLFEVNNIENTYEHGFPNSTSCDPEAREFCNKPSYFAPETIPENKGSDFGKPRSKCVHKVGVFDRLNSDPKALLHKQEHESDAKSELDATVDKVMKMLEKTVSGKMQSNFEQDDVDDNKIVDYELPKIIEETNVMDYDFCKKANKKNLEEEIKESFTVGNTSNVKKESTSEITMPLEVESLENVEKNGNEKSCEVFEKQEQGICGFAEMVRVDMWKDDGKMCGWIEE